MTMQKLTKEQAVIISAYTGYMAVNSFSDVHAAINAKLGRRVYTHELADQVVMDEVRNAFLADFLALIP